MPDDGGVSAVAQEPGAAVSLHLPPDALRVLTTSERPDQNEGDQADAAASATPPETRPDGHLQLESAYLEALPRR